MISLRNLIESIAGSAGRGNLGKANRENERSLGRPSSQRPKAFGKENKKSGLFSDFNLGHPLVDPIISLIK
jgi:hypothetical protein